MADTTVTFRTDNQVKEEAARIYDELGMNLSTALNLFLKQTVIKKKFPCSLDIEVLDGVKETYPSDFFDLFGKGVNLGLDEEPQELSHKEVIDL